MITSVLVANRGEIARRVFRTCRSLGISCVAVYSDADAASPHVVEADVAVRLPGSTASDTYLRADLLVEAAIRAGADAVHPGYGFLSESAPFARAVIDAGLVWIGPPVSAIESVGSKILAKPLMAAAGVPVLPELDPSLVTADDLPVMIKASAGGGGRGMRVVRRLADLPSEVEAASAEAASAFGDGTVFCEPFVERGRHIEVQVLADRSGTVWTLGERECSIQRRHQKVIEETPSVAVDAALRSSLFDAARAAASAIGYVGAGTVEFLVDSGRFYFLETNTRLQVEHPVTECVFGLDLVALQIAIASGSALPGTPPEPRGHAIEARLYAEDPARDWQPQTGTLHRFEIPSDVGGSPVRLGVVEQYAAAQPAISGANPPGPIVRVDAGVESGSVIGPHYDPMLAKVIAWAPDRSDAARLLASTLARSRIHGVETNRDLLVRALRHPAFLSGDTDTAFLSRHSLSDPLASPEAEALSAIAAALADAAANREAAPVLNRLPTAWRNLPSTPQSKRYTLSSLSGDAGALRPAGYIVSYRFDRTGQRLEYVDVVPDPTSDTQHPPGVVQPDPPPEAPLRRLSGEGLSGEGVEVGEVAGGRVVLGVAGVSWGFDVARYDGVVCVDSALGSVMLRPVPRFADPMAQTPAGSLLAPMPGTVIRIAVSEGDRVTAGQPLLWLEAMKMEHTIAAPIDGVVTELAVTKGQQVDINAVLAVVKEES